MDLNNIKRKKLEDELVKKLAHKISSKYKNFYTNRKPSSSSKCRNYLKIKLPHIPILQPEIDLILESHDGQLYAAEVKLFKTEEVNFNLPFYLGLGQALALHRYGFDKASLFHLFLGKNLPARINIYGPEIWAFIRNDLCIPLDYSYIWVEEKEMEYDFHVMQYIGRQNGIKLLKIDDPNFNINFRYENPIKDQPTQKIMRECLELWLKGKLK